MKNLIIPKQNKKVKIIITNSTAKANIVDKILTVTGPLGSISYNFKNQI